METQGRSSTTEVGQPVSGGAVQLQSIGINESALSMIQDLWKLSPSATSAITTCVAQSNNRYSLLSNIPIRCKGQACPYLGTCTVDINILPIGERCPIEIATLLTRFEKYCNELGITDDMTVDLGQIKELVDLEVMILRCDSKIASSVDFVEEALRDVTKGGVYIYEKVVSQEAQYKMTLYERHSKILKDLNATRSNKKNSDDLADASKAASLLMRRIKEVTAVDGMSIDDVLDVSYTPTDDDYIITEDEFENECDGVLEVDDSSDVIEEE